MASFKKIINSNAEDLAKYFTVFDDIEIENEMRMEAVTTELKLRTSQVLCAVGFNAYAENLPKVHLAMGFDTFNKLANERNQAFTKDIYVGMTLDNMLTIYGAVKSQPRMLEVMQYLLHKRLESIEGRIEETVNSMIIEKYKAEMRTIYNDGIASIEFAEERLDKRDSGFRALLNEVSIIVESKIIPVGDIFYRDSILPQEKRKMLSKGLIPKEFIEARLEDEEIKPEERKILYDYLKMNKN
jgi:hypothetical protein